MAKGTGEKTAIEIPFERLAALLDKRVDDPAVVSTLAKAGKTSVQSEYIIAKEAGFSFSLERPESGKGKKELKGLFLNGEGVEGHRAFVDLPKRFAFVPRAELLAALPEPTRTFKMGKGDVPASTPDDEVEYDVWTVDGYSILAWYSRKLKRVRNFTVTRAEDETTRDVSVHPLHFEAKPADAPKNAELLGMALLVAWAATRFGLSEKHAKSALGKQLLDREITPLAFLLGACGGALTRGDFDPRMDNFLWGYGSRIFIGKEFAARKPTDKAIAKLLHLDRDDERMYTDDYLGTFKKAVKNPFYVPDSWESFERLAPVLDARWADYEDTEFVEAPKLALYEKAAKLRDAQSIVPAKQRAPKVSAVSELTPALTGLIGRSLKDKAVKAVLDRALLPIGKKIDEQANAALGISYLGSNFDIDGKRQLGVSEVTFFAKGQKSYVRGLRTEVQFDAYQGPLPHDLTFGTERTGVVRALKEAGKRTDFDDADRFDLPKKRFVLCRYNRAKKLVSVKVGIHTD